MIAPESIEEVKQRASIVELIGEQVELRRQGGRYVGLCPFHGEKSPSFFVRDEEKSYRCFGCGASGNIFSFVMETRGLSFPEAVEDLAGRYGIKLKYVGRQEGEQATRQDSSQLFKITSLAWNFFSAELAKGPQIVRRYLTKRSLSDAQLAAYGVGFAPANWHDLSDFLRKQNIPDELLIKSGLVRRNQRGELFDLFRGRVIFPIFLDKNRIVGFGGRTVPGLLPEDDKNPKYINSPESEIYSKQRVLFGLPQAMAAIRATGEVYLVEGYMDVVGLWGGNVKNVVATCGTAVTEHHVRRLAQIARRVIVLFDGDRAGRDAAAKCFELFLNSGVDTAAYFMPDGIDPDELAIKHGASCEDELKKLRRAPLFDCYMEKYRADIAASGPAGVGLIAEKVAAVVRRVENSVEKALLINRAAASLMLDPALFRRIVEGATPAKVDHRSHAVVEAAAAPQLNEQFDFNSLPRFEADLVLAVMVRRELAEMVLHNAALCPQLSPLTLRFLSELAAIIGSDAEELVKRAKVRSLLDSYGESWRKAWIKAHDMAQDKRVDIRKMFDETVVSFRKRQLNQMVVEIDQLVLQEQDQEVKADLLNERVRLTSRIKELRPN